MIIDSASVKVMRSYDYCHFEVSLSASQITSELEVDSLRKEAARLADKAVEQYKVSKRNFELLDLDECNLASHRRDVERLKATVPESEWTPLQKAKVKSLSDREHWKRVRFNYGDDWEEQDSPDFDYQSED